MPTILIVDDNLLARLGLKHTNEEFRGFTFGAAASAQEAVTSLSKRSWDLCVVDISIAAPKGFQFLKEIRQSYPTMRVMVMSAYANSEHAAQARQLGASGYLEKNAPRTELIRAFGDVIEGRKHFPDTLPEGKVTASSPHPPALSAREQHVLAAFVAGKRVGEIAIELHLSIKTVSTYKRRMMNKLQLNSVADLVRHAIDHNLCGSSQENAAN